VNVSFEFEDKEHADTFLADVLTRHPKVKVFVTYDDGTKYHVVRVDDSIQYYRI